MWSEIGRGRNTAELSRKHVARSADGLIAEKVTSLPSSHDSLFIGEDEAVNLGAVVRLAMGEVDVIGTRCGEESDEHTSGDELRGEDC